MKKKFIFLLLLFPLGLLLFDRVHFEKVPAFAGAGIETYDDATTVQDAIQTKLVDDLTELFLSISAITAGSGVAVSSDDTAVGYLDGELVAGEGIDFTVNDPAGAETMTISVEAATPTNVGSLETATDAETLTGTDTGRAVSPANLKSMILDEDDMTSNLATKVASQQSIAAYIAANTLTGAVVRSKFRWKSVTQIYIGAGEYHHEGTVDQKVYWDSKLTYTVVTNGAPDWVYIYIDDSAVVTLGGNLLTNAEFVDNATEPTWSVTRKGWYTGSDRAIFAVYLVANDIAVFWHDGGNRVLYDTTITDAGSVDYDLTFVNLSLTAPSFATRISIIAKGESSQDGGSAYYRPEGSAASNGHFLLYHSTAKEDAPSVHLSVLAPGQVIELKHNVSDTSKLSIYTNGWYFPAGM